MINILKYMSNFVVPIMVPRFVTDWQSYSVGYHG